MDVSALTFATLGVAGDDGGGVAASATAATGGDLFARLLSGLGVTTPPVGIGDPAGPIDVDSPTDAGEAAAEAPPVDPALLLTRRPPAVAAFRPANPDAGTPGDDAPSDERPSHAEPETPTAASLGLPPLLAALVAPTLAQAAPPSFAPAAPAAPAAAELPVAAAIAPAPSAAPADVAGPAAPPVEAMPAAPAPPGAGATESPASVPAATPGEGRVTIGTASAPSDAVLASPPPGAVAAKPAPAPIGAAIIPDAVGAPPAPAVGATAKVPVVAAVTVPTPQPTAAPRRPPSLAVAPEGGVEPRKRSDRPTAIVDVATPLVPRSPLAAPLAAPAPDVAAAPLPAASPEPAALAEPLVEHQLDMAREGEWLDQLTRDIVRTASAEGSLRFRLNPEHLGSLQVEVTQGQAGASVRLTADTEQARSLIADARPQLVAEARAQGVRIAEAHVDLGGQGQSAPQSQAGTGGRGGRELPAQEYLTSWQPESADEEATPSRRSAAERYA